MSTSHPDTAPDTAPGAGHDTAEEWEPLLPADQTPTAPGAGSAQTGGGGPPLPPTRPPRTSGQRWLIGISIAALVALVLGLITLAALQFVKRPTSSVNPTPTTTAAPSATPATAAPSPSTAPAVTLGPLACPAAVAGPAHWQPIINTVDAGGATVETVSCANMMGDASLQALVTASRADQTVDALVFTNITAASPNLIFQVKGLLKGDAKISAYSTIMTAEVDKGSSLNAGKPVSAMTLDLYREFAWSSAKSAMAQTVFPGIFPDLTRYQAEADQAAVNQGRQPWKLSATSVATAMVSPVLGWPATTNTSATLLSGGGPHDAQAVVSVTGKDVVTTTLTVTLARLGDRSQNGIWEVVSVTAQGYSFTSPAPLSLLSSPVTIMGTGLAYEADAGHIWLLDHLYTPIGDARADGAQGMGPTTFTSTLSFKSSFTGGAQEGVLMITQYGAITSKVVPAALEKVLISGGQ